MDRIVNRLKTMLDHRTKEVHNVHNAPSGYNCGASPFRHEEGRFDIKARKRSVFPKMTNSSSKLLEACNVQFANFFRTYTKIIAIDN